MRGNVCEFYDCIIYFIPHLKNKANGDSFPNNSINLDTPCKAIFLLPCKEKFNHLFLNIKQKCNHCNNDTYDDFYVDLKICGFKDNSH